jgi:hypothetical protein
MAGKVFGGAGDFAAARTADDGGDLAADETWVTAEAPRQHGAVRGVGDVRHRSEIDVESILAKEICPVDREAPDIAIGHLAELRRARNGITRHPRDRTALLVDRDKRRRISSGALNGVDIRADLLECADIETKKEHAAWLHGKQQLSIPVGHLRPIHLNDEELTDLFFERHSLDDAVDRLVGEEGFSRTR